MSTRKTIAQQERALERERQKIAREKERQALRESKARERAEAAAAKLRRKHARETIALCKKHQRELAGLYKKHGTEPPSWAASSGHCPQPDAVTSNEHRDLMALEDLTTADLRSFYRYVYGAPTRNSRAWIVKKLADSGIAVDAQLMTWKRGRT